MEKRFFSAPDVYPPTWQYTPAISVRGGRTIYLSGIIGARPDGSLPAGDMVAQAELAFANLERVLAAAGATPSDVVKVNVYVGDDYAMHAGPIREIRSRYFTDRYPASTLVRVAGFANPAYLFEVEAIAVVDDASASM